MSGGTSAKPKRRIGCIVAASFLFALWITIAWLLWHLSMNMPAPDPAKQEEEEKPTFFELMPKAEGS